jgi:hypothetical protein
MRAHRANVRDPAAVDAAVADADVVIHAAGLAHVSIPTAAAERQPLLKFLLVTKVDCTTGSRSLPAIEAWTTC